jgi:hypothetical protein
MGCLAVGHLIYDGGGFKSHLHPSPIYIPPLSGRAIAEDIQMSENRTEEGVSCELPGTLVNESGDRAIQNNQKASVKSIPPIDLKVPESILTATFALG